MRRRSVLMLSGALAAAAIGGAAMARSDDAEDTAKLAKELAGLKPGKSMMCMPLNRTDGGIKAFGPNLVYTYTQSLKYVSKTTGGCEGVARGDILVTRQFQSRPCSGDIATTVDSASRSPTGSCTLGDFTEYRK